MPIECVEESGLGYERLKASAEFNECQFDAGVVQLDSELPKHVGRRHIDVSTGVGLPCSTPARVVLSYPGVGDASHQRKLRGMETIRWLRNGFPPCRQNNSQRSSL